MTIKHARRGLVCAGLVGLAIPTFLAALRRAPTEISWDTLGHARQAIDDTDNVERVLAQLGEHLPTPTRLLLDPDTDGLNESILVVAVDPNAHPALERVRANFAAGRLENMRVIICDVRLVNTLVNWSGSGEESMAGFSAWGHWEHVPRTLLGFALAHECAHLFLHEQSNRGARAEIEADEFAWRVIDQTLPSEVPRGAFLELLCDELSHIMRIHFSEAGQASLDYITSSRSHPPFNQRVFELLRTACASLSAEEIDASTRIGILATCEAFTRAAAQITRRASLASFEDDVCSTHGRTVRFENGFRFWGWLADEDAVAFSAHYETKPTHILYFDGRLSLIAESVPATFNGQQEAPRVMASADGTSLKIIEGTSTRGIQPFADGFPLSVEPNADFRVLACGKGEMHFLCVLPNRLALIDIVAARIIDELSIPGLDSRSQVFPSHRSHRVLVIAPRFLGQAGAVTGAIYTVAKPTPIPAIITAGAAIIVLFAGLILAVRRRLQGESRVLPRSSMQR